MHRTDGEPLTRRAARDRREAEQVHESSRRQARAEREQHAVDAYDGPDDGLGGFEYDEEPPRRRRRPWLPLLLALVLVGAGGYVAVKSLDISLPSIGGGSDQADADYTGEGTGSVTVTVDRGDTGSDIGATLQQAGVVKSGARFAQSFAAEQSAAGIQPGSYTLRKQMSSASALALMLDPSSRTGGVTVPEGLWASEIYQRLSKATGTPLAEYAKVDTSQLGLPAAAKGNVEGYLFPSRYDFPKNATATEQLRSMVTEFKRRTAALQIPPDRLERVLTIASIVQAESRGQDGPKVARVIENRLKPNTETAGRLQMDSTVHYLLKKRGTITTTDKQRQDTSPYNTYLHKGLPPGPVGNPGIEAIKAAEAPTPGGWLYFVTVNPATGETRFATTGAEHQKNVVAFQTWCRSNPGKC
ncbi:hypothetical protein VV01_09455 [Luteipulveratus halotolerans]|uniref:Endolytic murein transglycosylase n=1 Tax=Luteipulveratus halotolerans TaxID=1631356 RepID=A0A0L6CP79_9MICO|nr:hypothetical protein VV01_09455 [Luteipulveratus halotolerans]